MPKSKSFNIVISSDLALWSRPESKLHRDRSSYDYPTVSSLKEIISCVYKKPCFIIVIDKISCLNFGGRFAMTSYKALPSGNLLCGETYVKDVKYFVQFHFEPNFMFKLKQNWTGNTEDFENIQNGNFGQFFKKHETIFERRINSGEFYRIPCGGVKNAGAMSVEKVDNEIAQPDHITKSIVLEPMFLTFVFSNESTYPESHNHNVRNFINANQRAKIVWKPECVDGFIKTPNPEDLMFEQVKNTGIDSLTIMRYDYAQ